ncbi:MAG: UDP-3-O-(3-hydroxymyristoyl)glucosamine N-acyltransferase, partial [Gemmatimonadetes bacterium]|nr:UDP-3-O-(3-hydroxymyristoyl)glucosamine N-acyltransferase [Gemmatimonadota bacterium]
MARLTAGEIAAAVEGELEGDAHRVITGVAALETAQPHELSFVANPRYLPYLLRTRAGAVLVQRTLVGSVPEGIASVVVSDPHIAMYHALRALFPADRAPGEIHPTAVVDPTAELAEGVA